MTTQTTPDLGNLPALLAQLARAGELRAWDSSLGSMPWGDPDFSERMLREHLSQEHDLASRRTPVISRQIEWLVHHLDPRSAVLDAACGPGLYAQELVALGHSVTGIDLGPAAIRHARAEAELSAQSARFFEADLRLLDLEERFDAILLLFGQFHTFAPDEGAALLATLRHHLNPDGRLMLELRSPTHWDRKTYRTWWTAEGGLFGDGPHVVLYEHHWDEDAEAEVEGYYILHETGEIETFQITERLLSETVYRNLLFMAGFSVVTLHDSWPSEREGAWVIVEASV